MVTILKQKDLNDKLVSPGRYIYCEGSGGACAVIIEEDYTYSFTHLNKEERDKLLLPWAVREAQLKKELGY
jgi:hypothetical protein